MMKNAMMKFSIVALLLCCIAPLSAQSRIDKIVRELDKNDKVEKSIVNRRDSKSGKLQMKISSYSFTHADLCKRLIAAFEADEAKAHNSVVSKEDGEVSYVLTFYNDDMESLYCLDVEGAEGELAIIWRPKGSGFFLEGLSNINILGFNPAQWQVFGLSKEDAEQFKEDMQQLGEDLKEILPDWN